MRGREEWLINNYRNSSTQDLDELKIYWVECNGQSKLEKQEGVVLKELHLSFQAGSNCIWKQGPRTRARPWT